jgi:hypothetical protein
LFARCIAVGLAVTGLCVYELTYIVQEYWRVRGPVKDYTIVTALRRAG